MAYPFYAGQTFNYQGSLTFFFNAKSAISGDSTQQPDYSQWAINAWLYDQTGEILIATIPVANVSNTLVPASNGLYTMSVPASVTAQWPIGKAQLIVQVTTDSGAVIPTAPQWLRIKALPGINQ